MNVVSFCLFGDKPKYTRGMVENLKIVRDLLPDFLVYIHLGSGVPAEVVAECAAFSNARLVQSTDPDWILPAHRICYPVEADVLFSRDADSRINARDVGAMRAFMASAKSFHIVRDHVWHKSKIMAGLCGRKRAVQPATLLAEWVTGKSFGYGTDEVFLGKILYPQVAANALIHSNTVGYLNEDVQPLPELDVSTDFLGNVVDYKDDTPFFEFDYDWGSLEHVKFLLKEEKWAMMLNQRLQVQTYAEQDRKLVLFGLFQATYYLNKVPACVNALALFEKTNTFVDEHTINNSSFLFPRLNKKIVATTDVSRVPAADEIVIQYGNYPFAPDNLPIAATVYRHPMFFSQVKHDVVECADCWKEVGQIYILNLEERRDRYLECLVEMCRMGAPLDRVCHFKAKKVKVSESAHLNALHGAGENHIWALRHAIERKYENVLIVEDDLTFTSNVPRHQRDLKLFLERKYDYDVCLLSTSLYGDRREKDDLLLTSHQQCTTTAAYLVGNAPKILDALVEGNRLLLQTGDGRFTCDRYWNKLHSDNKFFVFKTKFGYQRPNYSNITGVFSCHFD
jgi:hypothetical protein